MRRIRKDTIRQLYREAILQVFGCGDSNLDKHLKNALQKDVHIAGNAPGEWVSSEGVLEIYCESGIPNASDIQDFSYEAKEFGFDPSQAVCYNSDHWSKIDKYVNLGIKGLGYSDQVYCEPFNGAVVGIYWS